jgi:hypothetical protein
MNKKTQNISTNDWNLSSSMNTNEKKIAQQIIR